MRFGKAVLAALALLFATSAAAAPAAPDHRLSVIESAEGWTFGKANAPLLAEYASYGCPHCGQFAAATTERIDRLVRAGKLRFAWRPFLIFPQDRAAAVLTRCIAAPRRLDFIKALMAQQSAIQASLQAADRDERLRSALFEAELRGPVDHSAAIAKAAGLLPLAESFGLMRPQANACLSSAANHDWVTEADMAARLGGITGTPTYSWKGNRLARTITPDELLALLPL